MTTFRGFEIKGIEQLDKISDKYGKLLQRKIDAESRKGVGKALDHVIYGRSEGVRVSTTRPDSVINMSAKSLRIDPQHVFYRTFTKTPKNKKPYASALMRGNGINLTTLLIKNPSDLKKAYGFKGRKGKTVKRERPNNMDELVANAIVKGVGVKIGDRTITNAFISDGRVRRDAEDDTYYTGRGAKKKKLNGKVHLVMSREGKRPYPLKVHKIEKEKVQRVFQGAIRIGVKRRSDSLRDIHKNQVYSYMRKLGFEIVNA